jgi:hypothetical protein
MRDKELPSFISTETIDLNSLFPRNVVGTGSFDLGGTLTTSLGKLLQTIPIPTMLVDGSCTIVFANEAFGKLSARGDSIELGSFTSLFSDSAAATEADSLIKGVFATRKPATKDAVMSIGTRRLLGRLHLRPLRVGRRRCVLVIVEDLIAEKKNVIVDQKRQLSLDRVRGRLEQRLQIRTAQLKITTERLRKEIAERKRVERVLDKTNCQNERDAEQRTLDLLRAREQPLKKRTGKQPTGECSPRKDQVQEFAAVASGTAAKFRTILHAVVSSTKSAINELDGGDLSGARDCLERILKHCRASARTLKSIERFGSLHAGVPESQPEDGHTEAL